MIESAMLPRVVVITSNNFNLSGGGGITLTNLFHGWPADRLANLHEDSTPPDRSVCRNFFRVTGREVHWSWPLSALEKPLTGRESSEGTTAVAQDGRPRRLKRRIISDGLPRSVTITPELERWVQEFNPQMAYGFLGSIAQMRLMRAIADRWTLPIVVHIMDDWPGSLYTNGLLAPALRRTMLSEFRELLDRASLRLAISHAMAREYEGRYGGSFQAFHNALRMDEWTTYARTEWSVGKPATVRYVGSVLAETQRHALRDLAEAVAGLRTEGLDVMLSVHAPSAHTAPLRDWGYGQEVVRLENNPAADDVPLLLASADVLVLPFNFNAASARYIRLSMPTKVPAYMISGTPVLVYGPPEVATVAYAAEGGWGFTVTDRDADHLRAGLRTLLTDVPLRQRLGERAVTLARQNHDIAPVKAAFWTALASTVHPAGDLAAATGGR
jgi:glycosyltransferase involved in cell wall biosynthesis